MANIASPGHAKEARVAPEPGAAVAIFEVPVLLVVAHQQNSMVVLLFSSARPFVHLPRAKVVEEVVRPNGNRQRAVSVEHQLQQLFTRLSLLGVLTKVVALAGQFCHRRVVIPTGLPLGEVGRLLQWRRPKGAHPLEDLHGPAANAGQAGIILRVLDAVADAVQNGLFAELVAGVAALEAPPGALCCRHGGEDEAGATGILVAGRRNDAKVTPVPQWRGLCLAGQQRFAALARVRLGFYLRVAQRRRCLGQVETSFFFRRLRVQNL